MKYQHYLQVSIKYTQETFVLIGTQKNRDYHSMLGQDPISGAALHIVSNKFISGYSYICGSQCSCIVKDLLVCGGLISWVTDLLCFKCQVTINSLL